MDHQHHHHHDPLPPRTPLYPLPPPAYYIFTLYRRHSLFTYFLILLHSQNIHIYTLDFTYVADDRPVPQGARWKKPSTGLEWEDTHIREMNISLFMRRVMMMMDRMTWVYIYTYIYICNRKILISFIVLISYTPQVCLCLLPTFVLFKYLRQIKIYLTIKTWCCHD